MSPVLIRSGGPQACSGLGNWLSLAPMELVSGPVLLPPMTLVWICSCSRGVLCPRPAPAQVSGSILFCSSKSFLSQKINTQNNQQEEVLTNWSQRGCSGTHYCYPHRLESVMVRMAVIGLKSSLYFELKALGVRKVNVQESMKSKTKR